MSQRKDNYIREWRENRGLTLRALEARIPPDQNGQPPLSYVSIGRIERGEQPYTRRTLELIAEALVTSPAALIWHSPDDVGRLLALWGRFNRRQKSEALQALDIIDRRADRHKPPG